MAAFGPPPTTTPPHSPPRHPSTSSQTLRNFMSNEKSSNSTGTGANLPLPGTPNRLAAFLASTPPTSSYNISTSNNNSPLGSPGTSRSPKTPPRGGGKTWQSGYLPPLLAGSPGRPLPPDETPAQSVALLTARYAHHYIHPSNIGICLFDVCAVRCTYITHDYQITTLFICSNITHPHLPTSLIPPPPSPLPPPSRYGNNTQPRARSTSIDKEPTDKDRAVFLASLLRLTINSRGGSPGSQLANSDILLKAHPVNLSYQVGTYLLTLRLLTPEHRIFSTRKKKTVVAFLQI